MKKNIFKILIFSCSAALLLFCSSALPAKAGIFDEIGNNLGTFNQSAQLPAGNSLVNIIINIINIALTFLGLVFIVLIIYGGFTYMTAGGKPEQAKKALGILRDAVIGIVIIALSYAIVNFIIIKILEVIK